MLIFTLIIAVLLSIFATGIMSYLSMAMPIGPWIETTLVLIGMLIFGIAKSKTELTDKIKSLGLVTAAGGIGGILATGIGFSFPTLYFVEPELFKTWLANPIYFISILALLSLSAGLFGFIIANFFEEKLIVKENMPFAIGQLVNKVIIAQNQFSKALSLFLGFVITNIFLYIQKCSGFIAKQILIISKKSFYFLSVGPIAIKTELVPMFWAVGFVTGHVIIIPLAVGFFAKILILDTLYYFYINNQIFYNFFSKTLFNFFGANPINSLISAEDFSVAFCSGMIIYGVIISFIGLPKNISQAVQNILKKDKDNKFNINFSQIWLLVLSVITCIIFFSYFKFSLLSQIYILVFTAIWTYQVLVIAGKISIAPLGRFATFVMVPGILLFGFTALQATLIATFVEIATGVAGDTLFGRKMARLSNISHKNIFIYQLIGLVISSITVGFIFWLIISKFGIGAGTDLPVVKAYSRALLINIKNFDFFGLFSGTIFGFILTKFGVNPALVLGGILMPPQYSLILILGGLSTYLVKEKEDYYPFWSGVFAGNSLWMILQAFIRGSCR